MTYRGNMFCGGQGIYIHHLSRALVELGHDVTVFSGQPYPHLDEGVRLVKVPSLDLYREPNPFRTPKLREIASLTDLLEFATMRSGGFPEPRTFGLRARAALLRRRGSFDLVHDNQSLASILIDLVRDEWPVLSSIHHPITVDRALDLEHARGVVKRASLRRWYGFARMQTRVARAIPRILTVSESSKSDIVKHLGVAPSRIGVVPVGVDTATYCPRPGTTRIPGRIMTTASSDVPLKGLIPLLESLARVRIKHDDAHLIVIGRLKRNSPVTPVIDRLGLAPFVTFVENETNDGIARRYSEAMCAVVPSLYEGFSLPAIEAMACGVPLVATTGGALPEVVGTNGESAILVPPGDPSALAYGIGQVLSDPDLAARIAIEARQRVFERYSWRHCAEQTVEQYRMLLDGVRSCSP